MSDIWEPWTPQIGQRVRVSLSAECQFRYTTGITHHPVMDGAIGVVREGVGHRCEGHDAGHAYAVWFEPVLIETSSEGFPLRWVAHCFAAIELEPVDG